jgi:hypothetical protein
MDLQVLGCSLNLHEYIHADNIIPDVLELVVSDMLYVM